MSERSRPRSIITRSLVAGATLLTGSVGLKSDRFDAAAECRSQLTRNSDPHDEWDTAARELCSSFAYLSQFGFNEYGFGRHSSLEELHTPESTLSVFAKHIAPLQPYSVSPSLRVLFEVVRWDDVNLVEGSTESWHGEKQPIIGLNVGGISTLDTGDDLYWILFHETAHTVGLDEQYAKDMEGFVKVADIQVKPFQAIGEDSRYPLLNGYNACPTQYADTVYSLFDESSYIQDDCLQGHPYTNLDEFTASALTSMHLFGDQFVTKFEGMSKKNQQIASFAIRALVNGLLRKNPIADIEKLIPSKVIALGAKL